MDIRELLEKADKKIFKVRSVDPDRPLSNIIPKKKKTKYQLRNKSAHRPIDCKEAKILNFSWRKKQDEYFLTRESQTNEPL